MKSRFISALELSKVMEDLGEKLSEEEVTAINISIFKDMAFSHHY